MSYPYRRRYNVNEVNRLRRSPINIVRNNNILSTEPSNTLNNNFNHSISYNNNEDNDVFQGYENTFNSPLLFPNPYPIWNVFENRSSNQNYTYNQNYDDEYDESDDERNVEIQPMLTDFIFNMINDINLEYVMEQSLNEQPTLEKTDNIINVSSQLYSTVENKFDTKDCGICLCDFEQNDMVSKLKCDHVFHNECIVEWGKYKSECPKCKSNI